MSTDPFDRLEAWLEFAQRNQPDRDHLRDVSYETAPISDADLGEALHKYKMLRARMRKYANDNATALARDLVSLLNRAADLGIVVCPDTEDEEIIYAIEWLVGDTNSRLDVGYDTKAQRWALMRRNSGGR